MNGQPPRGALRAATLDLIAALGAGEHLVEQRQQLRVVPGLPAVKMIDPAANAAYLTLARGEVAESLPVPNRSGDVVLVVDVAADGRVLGVEFLDAARQLPSWLDPSAR